MNRSIRQRCYARVFQTLSQKHNIVIRYVLALTRRQHAMEQDTPQYFQSPPFGAFRTQGRDEHLICRPHVSVNHVDCTVKFTRIFSLLLTYTHNPIVSQYEVLRTADGRWAVSPTVDARTLQSLRLRSHDTNDREVLTTTALTLN